MGEKSWKSKYEMLNKLGEGGNAKVYHVINRLTNEEVALKDLINRSKEKRSRFENEIKIVTENCAEVAGIIPIIESSIKDFWYTMPIAEPIIKHIKTKNEKIEDIIKGIMQLAETLSLLHKNEITHRDIKPSNIYFFRGRYCFGDFGLVDFQDNFNDLTRSDKGLGAIFTIAPEMKRNPKMSDGKAADVFSLAKTLWMLLTENELGFDGEYNFRDKSHGLQFENKYRGIHTVELEELLMNATKNDPNLRPNIKTFKLKLEEWIDVYKNFNKSQLSDWSFLNRQLFGSNQPDSTTWGNIDSIISVLNTIGTLPAYNHMLFSDGGGLNFKNVELANEKGCIYLYDTCGYCFLLKPKYLSFEGFGENYSWNYFMLEFDELTPIFDIINDFSREFLVEDYPSHYVSAQYAQYGVYDYDKGNPLPVGYKVLERYLYGKLLIVLNSGPYNNIIATYDGRHGRCEQRVFREYIEKLITMKNKLELMGYDEETILNSDRFSNNPFETKEINMKNEFQKYNSPKQFLVDNYKNWSFEKLLFLNQESKNIAFYLTFSIESNNYFLANEYLCKDGKIKKSEKDNLIEVYYVYNREDAIMLNKQCLEFISQKCVENGFDKLESYENISSIELKRIGKPSHLFTESEIKQVMLDADDRKDNMLVIDENGYAKVIDNMDCRFLYPVRHESWDAGKVYVGKYSKLATLKYDYISSLQGWLSYLESGKKIHTDYLEENRNLDDLISKIKKFY